MDHSIVIERLELPVRIGVGDEERRTPQPIGIDLEMDCPDDRWRLAVADDAVIHTIDYGRVARRIREVVCGREYRLVESLAEDVATCVFENFSARGLRLWARKLKPPIDTVRGSVGVRIERTRPRLASASPADFLVRMTDRLPKGTVLDVAAGSGRHSLYLGAQPGYHVEAVDREENALAALRDAAHEQNILSITTRVVDLENPRQPAEFGTSRYDVILVFFYLYRPLMPALLRALAPGGMLVYETFLADNHLRYGHPRRREFCLESNELLRLASGLRVLHYDEGRHGDAGHGSHDAEGAITAQLLAVKNP